MPKVLLVIPPDYDTNFPPLGTPALAGFLKSRGIDVSQTDLNLGYRDFLCDHLSGADINREEARIFLADFLKNFFTEKLNSRYYAPFLIGKKDPILPYLPYGNNTNSSFHFAERILSSDVLGRYLDDAEENTFLQFFLKNNIVEDIRNRRISLVGLSVISPSQAIAVLTLGRLVKKNLPDVHVTLGGPWVTLFRRELMRRRDLWGYFDSLIVFEGETPLCRLAEDLASGKKGAIPNVIFKNSRTDYTHRHTQEDLDNLPPPDFDGLPLNDYDAREGGARTVTFETSRGCYWSKCAYCVDLPLPKPSYRAKNARLVVRDMKALRDKYGVGFVMLGDPGMSPRQMLEVSRCMIKEKVLMKWWCMARLDPGFTPEVFSTAARAGLTHVNFGFESACDRVCRHLDKGNMADRSSRIIKSCAASGIRVGLQTMLGLPGESFEEGLDTIDFLIRHKEFVTEPIFNIYYLTPSNHVFNNPKKYGIVYKRDRALSFRFFYPFENSKGMTMDQAQFLQDTYEALTREKTQPGSSLEISRLPVFAPGVKEERIVFSLLGESIEAETIFQPGNRARIFMSEEFAVFWRGVRQGATVKDILGQYANMNFTAEKALRCVVHYIKECEEGGFFASV